MAVFTGGTEVHPAGVLHTKHCPVPEAAEVFVVDWDWIRRIGLAVTADLTGIGVPNLSHLITTSVLSRRITRLYMGDYVAMF